MEMNEKTFSYTYSASQQAEIKRIREKYVPPTEKEDKMERLRRLDRSVTRPGLIASLMVGIVSTLILGFGMCCTMVWTQTLFVPGIIIGIVGILGICAAYPLYTCITKRRRKRLAPEIMQLADELLKLPATKVGGVSTQRPQSST